MPELLRPDGHKIAYHQITGQTPGAQTPGAQTPGAQTPGVIFLGGFKSDMSGSKALSLEHWCQNQNHNFLRFDYLGHGTSSGRFEDGTIGRWRDDALAVLDELSKGPQILVGSSMGGWISLLLALARPQRIAGIITIAAAADFTETLIWQQLPAAVQARLRREGVWQRPSDYDENAYPITYQLIEEARQHQLLNQTEIAIHCPLRLLHGLQDNDVPWQTSVAIAERLSGNNVRVELIKDGEHRLARPEDLTRLHSALSELVTIASH